MRLNAIMTWLAFAVTWAWLAVADANMTRRTTEMKPQPSGLWIHPLPQRAMHLATVLPSGTVRLQSGRIYLIERTGGRWLSIDEMGIP